MTREAGGNLDKAACDLSKAIALDPQDAEAYEQRGIVCTNQRKLALAIVDYDKAIRPRPDYAQASSDRGVTFYLGGDNDKAVRDYDVTLRLDPDRPRTYVNGAAAYKKLGKLDKTLADANEAIRRDAKVPEYFDNGGLTYAAMGDYHTALRLDPNFALACNNRAVLYKKMDERAKALSDHKADLRFDPGNENAASGRRITISEIARFCVGAPRPLNPPDLDPSFDCDTAKLAGEKAICADPKLGTLDHQITNAYASLMKAKGSRADDAVRRAQGNFIAERNASFGQPAMICSLPCSGVSMPSRIDRIGAAHFLGSRCSLAESAGGKMLS